MVMAKKKLIMDGLSILITHRRYIVGLFQQKLKSYVSVEMMFFFYSVIFIVLFSLVKMMMKKDSLL